MNFSWKRLIIPSVLFLSAGLIVIGLHCGRGSKSKNEAGVCPEPEPGPEIVCPQRCEPSDVQVLLTPGGGTGAYARQITDAGDLLPGAPEHGGFATGRIGDYLIGNDKIKVIVSQPDRVISPNPFGGNIIDASAIVGGNPTPDYWGSFAPYINLALTANTCKIEVLSDGQSGGSAIIAATGEDAILDYLNIVSIPKLLGLPLTFPYDPNADLPLAITTYYILKPGENYVTAVTSYCNTGSEKTVFPAGDMIDSRGDLELFNPLYDKPFGAPTFSELLGRYQMDFLAWLGDEGNYEGTSYAYVPDGDKNLSITYAGVTGTVIGNNDLTLLMSTIDPNNPPEGVIALNPGDGKSVIRHFVVSADGIGGLTETIYSKLRTASTATVNGTVKEETTLTPIEGARVSVLKKQGTTVKGVVTQFKTDASGQFSGTLPQPPAGYSYVFSADGFERPRISASDSSAFSTLPSTSIDLQLGQTGVVTLRVQDNAGNPIPAKVTFRCTDPVCPKNADANYGDTRFDPLNDDIETVAFVHPENFKTIQVTKGGYYSSDSGNIIVAPGTYDIYVSRGMEYDRAVQSVTVNACAPCSSPQDLGTFTLHRVVDTTGYLSGDFHVHSINSPDAVPPLVDRVMTFAGEGVDILVATDHDYVTDYKPVINQLNLQKFLTSVIGDELTTWDFGHFNAFPLTPDPTRLANGALDWGNGTGYTMTPCQIFEGLLADPGEEVLQVNHPRGEASFQAYFSAIQLDTLTKKTKADPNDFRMPPDWAKGSKDNTLLFSDMFTAMEIYNSYDYVDTVLNDWFTFLNTGLIVTGTGVSDTHKKVATSAGMPRTFIKMSTDDPSQLNEDELVENVNAHRVIISNGPFVTAEIENASGQKAGIGELIYSGGTGQQVTLRIRIQTPDWMKYDTVKVFSNTQGTATGENGEQNATPPTPLKTYKLGTDFKFDASTEVPSDGGKRYEVTITDKFTVDADAWFVVQVKTENNPFDLFPINFNNKERPLAITNPVFVTVEDDNDFDPPGATRNPSLTGASVKSTGVKGTGEQDVRTLFNLLDREYK
jgi:hypothetical protein